MAASSGEPDGAAPRPGEPGGAPQRRAGRSQGPGRSDIAEFLSGGMMTGLTVLILGLLGLIYVFSESGPPGDATDAAVTVEPSEAVTAARVNGVEDEAIADDVVDDPGATGQDIDSDGDVGADERPAAEGRTGGDAAAGGDVDGDGDTAGDRESQPEPPGDAATTTPTEPPDDSATTERPVDDGSQPTLPGPGERGEGDAAIGPSELAEPSEAATAPTDSAAGMPDRSDGTGLFSPDDPGRQVAITPDTRPRDERVVHVDLDGDGEKERVWAAVVTDRVLTRIERVVDGAWTPVSEHTGAVADSLVALRARDLTGDGRPEIYTRQRVGTEGESITLWSYADDGLQRMSVTGGCADGSNTLGLVGALVRVPESDRPGLVAVCRDPGLPPQQWPSGLYEWRDGTWTFLRLEGEMP